MKAFLVAALQAIVRSLVGALNYERVKLLVTDLESTELTGPQKRDRVITECQSVVLAVGMSLFNLAIETAVASMKVK
jgi:hypothetical protein